MWRFKFCSLFVCVFSAGIGRSGTFVALLWLMQLCVRGIRPDIRAAVEDLRLHRMCMVQNPVSLLTFTGSQTLAFHKQIGLYICSIFIKTQWPHIVSPARACSFVYILTRTHWGTVKSGVHTLHLFLAPLFRMCLGYIHLTKQTKKTLFCPLLHSRKSGDDPLNMMTIKRSIQEDIFQITRYIWNIVTFERSLQFLHTER